MTHEANDPAVLELRRYILHPGGRDALVALFEREFVETQEALGMTVLGQFHDLDHADRFVWLRGLHRHGVTSWRARRVYDGPVWRAHREAANATMIDSDDVLLLRPAWPGAGAALPGLLLATLLHLRAPADAGLLALCRELERLRLAPTPRSAIRAGATP
jgi:hypothetical protein